MEVTFVNPGIDYMISQIMEFQAEDESAFWSEPLYHFYPQLDKAYAASLPFPKRREYIEHTMRKVYAELGDTINEKAALYSRQWEVCKEQIAAALSDAFCVDCVNLFNDIRSHTHLFEEAGENSEGCIVGRLAKKGALLRENKLKASGLL